jgi:translation initiation factor IF-2
VFTVSKVGNIAGCRVVQGEIRRNGRARVMRGGTQIHDGEIGSLKIIRDDVREVRQGFECGISLKNFPEILVGDSILCYILERV